MSISFENIIERYKNSSDKNSSDNNTSQNDSNINKENSLINGVPNIITYFTIGVGVIIGFFALAYASLLLFPGNPIGKLIMDLYRGLSYTKKAHKIKSAFKSKKKSKNK